MEESSSMFEWSDVFETVIIVFFLLNVFYVFYLLCSHHLILLPLVAVPFGYILLIAFDLIRTEIFRVWMHYSTGNQSGFIKWMNAILRSYPIAIKRPITDSSLLLAALLVVSVFAIANLTSKLNTLYSKQQEMNYQHVKTYTTFLEGLQKEGTLNSTTKSNQEKDSS